MMISLSVLSVLMFFPPIHQLLTQPHAGPAMDSKNIYGFSMKTIDGKRTSKRHTSQRSLRSLVM